MRNFEFWWHQDARLLRWQRAFHLVFPWDEEIKRELRQSGDVEVEVAVVLVVVAVAAAVGGSHTFRSGYDAACDAAAASFVVTTLVSTQGLASGEGLVADGALVSLTADVVGGCDGACPGSGGGGGGRGCGRVFASTGTGEFPVAGLVSTKCLVRGEGLAANRALINSFRGRCSRHLGRHGRTRRLVMLRGGGSCAAAATSEHDKAKSKVLFLCGWVIKPSSLRTLALRPWLKEMEVGVLEVERRGGCVWRIESFQRHLFCPFASDSTETK
ncbi:hypothetical protein CIPAW_08G049400 [Carya illinoinensis]|uniref:Uncharacterized protein n=1 Tax=Carya illinoinensis TaxID=32201 RepID=A0A8T1PRQ3_CARIL|nr:hypothetical protein CIPAW_08G049400 [Carya illinoinensis]